MLSGGSAASFRCRPETLAAAPGLAFALLAKRRHSPRLLPLTAEAGMPARPRRLAAAPAAGARKALATAGGEVLLRLRSAALAAPRGAAAGRRSRAAAPPSAAAAALRAVVAVATPPCRRWPKARPRRRCCCGRRRACSSCPSGGCGPSDLLSAVAEAEAAAGKHSSGRAGRMGRAAGGAAGRPRRRPGRSATARGAAGCCCWRGQRIPSCAACWCWPKPRLSRRFLGLLLAGAEAERDGALAAAAAGGLVGRHPAQLGRGRPPRRLCRGRPGAGGACHPGRRPRPRRRGAASSRRRPRAACCFPSPPLPKARRRQRCGIWPARRRRHGTPRHEDLPAGARPSRALPRRGGDGGLARDARPAGGRARGGDDRRRRTPAGGMACPARGRVPLRPCRHGSRPAGLGGGGGQAGGAVAPAGHPGGGVPPAPPVACRTRSRRRAAGGAAGGAAGPHPARDAADLRPSWPDDPHHRPGIVRSGLARGVRRLFPGPAGGAFRPAPGRLPGGARAVRRGDLPFRLPAPPLRRLGVHPAPRRRAGEPARSRAVRPPAHRPRPGRAFRLLRPADAVQGAGCAAAGDAPAAAGVPGVRGWRCTAARRQRWCACSRRCNR